MDEKIKILELVRDGKVSPEQGLELLDAIGAGGASKIVDNFVGLHSDEGPARHLRISTLSRKGKEFNFTIPLSVVRFTGNLFPNRFRLNINNKQLDTDELMDAVYRQEKGVIYEDESENVVVELI